MVASWFRLRIERSWVRALAGDIVLRSWARHLDIYSVSLHPGV